MQALWTLLAQQSSTAAALDQSKRTLQTFIQTHRMNIGTHPFLVGLKHVLQANAVSPFTIDWKVKDLVFTESGGSLFMTEAVQLLTKTLCFQLSETQWESDGTSFHIWSCDPTIEATQLRQLVKLFPKSHTFQTGPTGEFLENPDRLRVKQVGNCPCCCVLM